MKKDTNIVEFVLRAISLGAGVGLTIAWYIYLKGWMLWAGFFFITAWLISKEDKHEKQLEK